MIAMCANPAQLDDWSAAIEGYRRLYEIPERWQQQWDEIDSVISLQLRSALKANQYSYQQPVTQIDFRRIVSRIIEALEEPTGRYFYPARRWLVWAQQYRLERLYEAHVEARGLDVSTSS